MRSALVSSLRWNSLQAPLAYLLMIAGTFAAVVWLCSVGESLAPPALSSLPTPEVATKHSNHTLLQMLLALVVIVAASQLAARAFAFLRQPPVIGEVCAGILLGPSLLGWVAPSVYAQLLPAEISPSLALAAQAGVILYMFAVGLELDTSVLRRHGHSIVAISHASIIAPFVLGLALALGLHETMAPEGIRFTPFALFLGTAMSVTAFPVLARILTDRQLAKTPFGVASLTCAAVDDITAWCLLALVVGVARAELGNALQIMLMAGGYVAAMWFLLRPALLRTSLMTGNGRLTKGWTSLILGMLLLSAWATEAIGIHAIFGAFLLGAIIPHDSRVARELPKTFETVVGIVLLPAFFAFTGMRTQIHLIGGWENWLWCGAIVALATLGKFGGSAVAARLCGMSWRESSALGVLMNTRGLMELIILNVGLDLGVISPRLFAMMVVMALVTTMATSPLLHLLGIGRHEHEPVAA